MPAPRKWGTMACTEMTIELALADPIFSMKQEGSSAEVGGRDESGSLR